MGAVIFISIKKYFVYVKMIIEDYKPIFSGHLIIFFLLFHQVLFILNGIFFFIIDLVFQTWFQLVRSIFLMGVVSCANNNKKNNHHQWHKQQKFYNYSALEPNIWNGFPRRIQFKTNKVQIFFLQTIWSTVSFFQY